MIRAFLSHSSKDKESYVRQVAKWLGKDNIIYDEFTFEEGGDTLEEILNGLGKTDLFVLFLSSNALNSDWVIREIVEAKRRFNESTIAKIYPIIIEDGLTYQDERIPDWLKENFVLKPIKTAQVAARRIHNKLRELSWAKHPEAEKKQNLFVGRNSKLEEFEERMHDFGKTKPIAIFASGFSGVGRRTFLHRALHKTNLTELSYKPSAIFLDRSSLIEDFILKLNDLGLVDISDAIKNLAAKTLREKQDIIQLIMDAAYSSKELIYILEDGCLVNNDRKLVDWFSEAVSSYTKSSMPLFCIASKYTTNFRSRPRNDKFYFVELNELNPKERQRLFQQLLEIYDINLNTNDFSAFVNLLVGLPDQAMYAIDLLRVDNLSKIEDKLPALSEYNNSKAVAILKRYSESEIALEFIRLLAEFEVISQDFIFSIVPEKTHYSILESLVSENICELIGAGGEIIRLNDIIRDFIKRNTLNIKDEFRDKLMRQVSLITNSDDIFQKDSSDYIYAMKETLKDGGDIPEEFLIPSHYVRCIKDLYYNRGSNNRIIELADILLQKKATLDAAVVEDVQYYLCSALARKKDKRMLEEVQAIKGDKHKFLLGFYYRLCGRYEDALEKFIDIADVPYVGSRSSREIVQVYVSLEEHEKAIEYAEKNYHNNPNNQFHIQAYLNCLLKSENSIREKQTIKSLIEELRSIDSEQSNEMADIADAEYCAKVLNNKQKSRDKIEDCIAANPGNHYPLLTLCDIALKFNDQEMLAQGLAALDKIKTNRDFSNRTVDRYRAFSYALQGDERKAIQTMQKHITRYPAESKERILSRLKECSRGAIA